MTNPELNYFRGALSRGRKDGFSGEKLLRQERGFGAQGNRVRRRSAGPVFRNVPRQVLPLGRNMCAVLLVLGGSSGAGKSAIRRFLVGKGSENLAGLNLRSHDLDEHGVPGGADSAWRQRTGEEWIQRAIEYENEGVDLLLSANLPLGEILAAPSAPRVDGIAVCLIDCRDTVPGRAAPCPRARLLHRPTHLGFHPFRCLATSASRRSKMDAGGDHGSLVADEVGPMGLLDERRSPVERADLRHFRRGHRRLSKARRQLGTRTGPSARRECPSASTGSMVSRCWRAPVFGNVTRPQSGSATPIERTAASGTR
jgi:hypothetical protein